jgi:hypothetical protein
VLWLCVAGVVVPRLWATRHAQFPFVSADEPAYLSMARLIAGDGGWNLGDAATYGPGYSALIAPWFALGLDPDQLYRAAIFTNIAVWVGSFLVLEVLTRRLTTLRRPWSAVVALSATLPTSLIVLAGYAWSDSLAVLAFLLLVWACVGLAGRPTLLHGSAVAVACVVAYAVHARLAPAVLVALGLLGLLAWRRRMGWRDAGLSVAAAVLGLLGVQVASGAIHDRLYESADAAARVTEELSRALRPWPVTASVSGQLWYLVVTTAGLAGVGVVALARSCRPGARSAGPGMRSSAALWVTAALVAVTFLASAGFMTDRPRPDHMVYGRYNDAIVGLLIVLGVARWSARGRRGQLLDGAVALGTVLTTAAIVWLARSDVLAGPYSGVTIRSLAPLGAGGPGRLWWFTLTGAAVITALTVLRVALGGRRPAFVLAVLALFAVGAARGVAITTGPREGDPRAAVELRDLVPEDEVVAMVADPSIPKQAFFRFPFYAPDLRLHRTEDPVWQGGSEGWILAPIDFEPVQRAGYRPVWTDPVSSQTLWRSPTR